jgi:cysteinyl-tRNA synthetase
MEPVSVLLDSPLTPAQVMNITDVDDKIILKARRNHLLKQFFAAPPPPAAVLDRVRQGILSTTTKLQVVGGIACNCNAIVVNVIDHLLS